MQHDSHTILWIYGEKKKHWTVNFVVNFMICELCSIKKKKNSPRGKVSKNSKFRWKFHDGHSSFLIVLSTWAFSSKLFQISKPSSGQKMTSHHSFPFNTYRALDMLVYQLFSLLRYIYSAMVSYLFGSTCSFAIMSWVYFFNSAESFLKMVTLSHYSSFLPTESPARICVPEGVQNLD